MEFRQFVVAESAMKAARRNCGMYGNVENRLKGMARLSTPYTCPQGNRRYDDYILTITKDNVIISIEKLAKELPKDVMVIEDYREYQHQSKKKLIDLTRLH